MVYPPLVKMAPTNLEEVVACMEPTRRLRIEVKGETMNGKEYTKVLMLKVGDETTGKERLAGIGFETRQEDGKILVDNVVFSSRAEKAGIDFDQEILNIQMPSERPDKELMVIPALLLYGFVWFVQNRRSKKLRKQTAAA